MTAKTELDATARPMHELTMALESAPAIVASLEHGGEISTGDAAKARKRKAKKEAKANA